jgi:hypothetical protein
LQPSQYGESLGRIKGGDIGVSISRADQGYNCSHRYGRRRGEIVEEYVE